MDIYRIQSRGGGDTLRRRTGEVGGSWIAS
jgi:hypothetical protein